MPGQFICIDSVCISFDHSGKLSFCFSPNALTRIKSHRDIHTKMTAQLPSIRRSTDCIRLLLIITYLTVLTGLSAQSSEPPLSPATPITIGNFQPYPDAEAVKITPASGDPYGVLRVETFGPRPQIDSTWQLRATLEESFQKSDVLFLSFKVRCLETKAESGTGQIGPLVEMKNAPYTKTIWGRFPVVKEWTEIQIPGRIGRDYSKGEINLNLRVGYDSQIIEIKDLQLWKLPAKTDLATLPVTTPPLYEGHEENAPWRQEAQERIEKYRKQDITVRVLDSAGNTVPGATVRLEQTRHAFAFGTAVALKQLFEYDKPADTALYQSILLKNFDACGTEYDLKWPSWEKTRERTLHGLEWLHQNGFEEVRGHVLLWPSFRLTPDYLRDAEDDPERLRQLILDHIKDIIVPTAPYVRTWDVINEPRLHHEILDLLGGESFMTEVFKEAQRWLPQGRFFLNEALALSPGPRMDALEQTTRFLLEEGAPIHGLGIQCHYNGWVVTPPAQLIETLDRLEPLGLDIEVTEFDVDSADDAFQARYLRDFYTAVFSHPSVTGIQMWGFWEGRHWKPSAALWKRDWTPRPAALTYLDLVRGEWWTQASGRTAADGTWSKRGFKGEYHITVLMGETVVGTRTVKLDEAPLSLDIHIQR